MRDSGSTSELWGWRIQLHITAYGISQDVICARIMRTLSLHLRSRYFVLARNYTQVSYLLAAASWYMAGMRGSRWSEDVYTATEGLFSAAVSSAVVAPTAFCCACIVGVLS